MSGDPLCVDRNRKGNRIGLVLFPHGPAGRNQDFIAEREPD